MKFTLVWSLSALDELAQIWLSSSNRRKVTDAAAEVDRQLKADALNAGESRGENRRIFIEPPLAIIFDISPDDRIVTVVRARRSKSEAAGDE